MKEQSSRDVNKFLSFENVNLLEHKRQLAAAYNEQIVY